MRLPADMVEIAPADPDLAKRLRIRVRLGDGDVNYQGGVGGWEAVARPRHRPLTVWRGPQDALSYPLPILFDGWLGSQSGDSVEDDVRRLEKMAGLDRGDPEPPLLVIEGALPHDESRAPSNRWVIADVTWGDTIRRRSDGHRVRVACIVHLILHEADARLARVQPPAKPRHRLVKPHRGETWNQLSARELGTRRLAGRLARLNGQGRSGSAVIHLLHVKLPSGSELASWRRDLKRG